jgi:Fur family transcriptional regulator, peroxide stress response regulator
MKQCSKERLAAFAAACRRRGLRLTPQRMEIFRALATATDHPTAEQLHERLQRKMPTLSLDTVYRTLATLTRHELVNKVDTVESQAHFEVQEDSHHHLICHQCREISDFAWPLIDDFPFPEEVKSWGEVNRKSVTVYGICRKCRGKR